MPAGELDDALLQRRGVGRREAAHHRVRRALEEAVGDVDVRRAVAQRRERVDDALGLVVALDHLGGLGALEAVALVVDDQPRAVGLARPSRRRSR